MHHNGTYTRRYVSEKVMIPSAAGMNPAAHWSPRVSVTMDLSLSPPALQEYEDKWESEGAIINYGKRSDAEQQLGSLISRIAKSGTEVGKYVHQTAPPLIPHPTLTPCQVRHRSRPAKRSRRHTVGRSAAGHVRRSVRDARRARSGPSGTQRADGAAAGGPHVDAPQLPAPRPLLDGGQGRRFFRHVDRRASEKPAQSRVV